MALATARALATVLGQGHRPRNVAEGYGEVTIKTQAAAAIARLSGYKSRFLGFLATLVVR
jgi:hypothetical protein